MGNEMGNRNINGLQVSEQENDETSEVIDQSPNTSILSLNGLDGLKGVSEYLMDDSQNLEEHEADNLATEKLSEPSPVFSVAEDRSKSNSTGANQEKLVDAEQLVTDESMKLSTVPETNNQTTEKEYAKLSTYDEPSTLAVSDTNHTDLASTESTEEDENLLQRIIPDGTEIQEAYKDAADESLEIWTTSMEKDDQTGSTAPREHQDSTNKFHNSADDESCKVMIQDQTLLNKGSERDLVDQDSEKNTTNKSLEDSVVPNDVVPMPLMDHNDSHEKQSDSDQNGSDENLIQKQIFEQKENVDAMTVVQQTNGKDSESKDVPVERKSSAASVLKECRPDEPINATILDAIDCEIRKILESNAAYPGTITVNQETNSKDYKLKDDLVERKSPAASVLEEQRPDEEINAAYLDAIDSEIGRLLKRNDLDGVGKQSKTELNGFQGTPDYDKETYGEELTMDDSENDSFDIELNASAPSKEENGEDAGSDAVFELAIQTGYIPGLETPVVEMGNSNLHMDTCIVDGECENDEISTVVESKSPDQELNDQVKVVPDATKSDASMNQVTVANAIAPTSPLLFEELAQKCAAMEDEALANKEELFAIDIIQENTSNVTFNSDFKPENERQVRDIINPSMDEIVTGKKEVYIPTESAWCIPILESEALEGRGSNFNVNSDCSIIESVKCVTYEYEKNSNEAEEENTAVTEESKQKPPFGHESNKSKALEVPGIDVREYQVSTSNEDTSKVSDKSPLLSQRKSEEGRESTEGTDSEKLRMPFSNFMKQEGTVIESAEKEEVLLLKKTVKESWQIPSKKSTTTSSTSREKQKPRSSLFGSCMCCTTAIN